MIAPDHEMRCTPAQSCSSTKLAQKVVSGTMRPPSLTWQNERISLPLRLGPIQLFRFYFPALVCKMHFTRLQGMPKLPPFDRDAETVLVPSMPVEHPPNRIRITGNA